MSTDRSPQSLHSRRAFLKTAGAAVAGMGLGPEPRAGAEGTEEIAATVGIAKDASVAKAVGDAVALGRRHPARKVRLAGAEDTRFRAGPDSGLVRVHVARRDAGPVRVLQHLPRQAPHGG